jgi:hypothetical protein
MSLLLQVCSTQHLSPLLPVSFCNRCLSWRHLSPRPIIPTLLMLQLNPHISDPNVVDTTTPIHVLPPSLVISLFRTDDDAADDVKLVDVRVAQVIPQELRVGGGSVTVIGSNLNASPSSPSLSPHDGACWACILLRSCSTCFQRNNGSSRSDFLQHQLASSDASILSPSLASCRFSATQVQQPPRCFMIMLGTLVSMFICTPSHPPFTRGTAVARCQIPFRVISRPVPRLLNRLACIVCQTQQPLLFRRFQPRLTILLPLLLPTCQMQPRSQLHPVPPPPRYHPHASVRVSGFSCAGKPGSRFPVLHDAVRWYRVLCASAKRTILARRYLLRQVIVLLL